jgi:hypothetical protein
LRPHPPGDPSFETTPPGELSKREPQTDERKVLLELGLEGKFAAKSTGWDDRRGLCPFSARRLRGHIALAQSQPSLGTRTVLAP